MTLHPKFVCIAAALLIVATTGCKTVQSTFKPRSAKVSLEFEKETIEILIEESRNPLDNCESGRLGLAALQVENWDSALVEFQKAATEKPKVHSYQLAVAALLERKGSFAEAQRHYEDANRLKGGEGSPEAQMGVRRIKARGK